MAYQRSDTLRRSDAANGCTACGLQKGRYIQMCYLRKERPMGEAAACFPEGRTGTGDNCFIAPRQLSPLSCLVALHCSRHVLARRRLARRSSRSSK